jgi:hypothetical protein
MMSNLASQRFTRPFALVPARLAFTSLNAYVTVQLYAATAQITLSRTISGFRGIIGLPLHGVAAALVVTMEGTGAIGISILGLHHLAAAGTLKIIFTIVHRPNILSNSACDQSGRL